MIDPKLAWPFNLVKNVNIPPWYEILKLPVYSEYSNYSKFEKGYFYNLKHTFANVCLRLLRRFIYILLLFIDIIYMINKIYIPLYVVLNTMYYTI